MKGHRDLNTGLWRINLCPNNQQMQIAKANNAYELRNTGALVKYLHRAMLIPTKSALLKAIKSSPRNLERSHRG